MDMKEQQYILAIAHYGTIKDAAKELCITPSALSIYLSTLEERCGTRFFDRIGKQFVPTEAGSLYLKRAKEIMVIRDRYEEELLALRNESAGTVRIGIHPRRTLYLIPAVLRDFSVSNPGIRVEIHELSSSQMFEQLADGTLDLIITNVPNRNISFSSEHLYSERLVAVLPADHPAAASAIELEGLETPWLDLKLLAGEQFILQQPFQSARQYADEALSFAGVTVSDALLIENMETASQLAAEGLGIAFSYESFAKKFRYEKPIRFFLVGDPSRKIEYRIFRNERKFHPDYIQTFAELLKKHI